MTRRGRQSRLTCYMTLASEATDKMDKVPVSKSKKQKLTFHSSMPTLLQQPSLDRESSPMPFMTSSSSPSPSPVKVSASPSKKRKRNQSSRVEPNRQGVTHDKEPSSDYRPAQVVTTQTYIPHVKFETSVPMIQMQTQGSQAVNEASPSTKHTSSESHEDCCSGDILKSLVESQRQQTRALEAIAQSQSRQVDALQDIVSCSTTSTFSCFELTISKARYISCLDGY